MFIRRTRLHGDDIDLVFEAMKVTRVSQHNFLDDPGRTGVRSIQELNLTSANLSPSSSCVPALGFPGRRFEPFSMWPTLRTERSNLARSQLLTYLGVRNCGDHRARAESELVFPGGRTPRSSLAEIMCDRAED